MVENIASRPFFIFRDGNESAVTKLGFHMFFPRLFIPHSIAVSLRYIFHVYIIQNGPLFRASQQACRFRFFAELCQLEGRRFAFPLVGIKRKSFGIVIIRRRRHQNDNAFFLFHCFTERPAQKFFRITSASRRRMGRHSYNIVGLHFFTANRKRIRSSVEITGNFSFFFSHQYFFFAVFSFKIPTEPGVAFFFKAIRPKCFDRLFVLCRACSYIHKIPCCYFLRTTSYFSAK